MRACLFNNSIRIKWIATVGIEKLVLKQGKMIGYFVCRINNQIIISRSASVMDFVQNKVQSVRLKKKKPRPA
jgi:transcription-repair coupling factor (superfamily II helicase)